MINFRSGNILLSDVEAIVLGVSCDGVIDHREAMRREKVFPSFHTQYTQSCYKGVLTMESILLTHNHQIKFPHYLINFPVTKHFLDVVRLEDVKKGIPSLIQTIKDYKITSVAVSPLGVELGRLTWKEVKEVFVQAFTPLKEVEFFLYEPNLSF